MAVQLLLKLMYFKGVPVPIPKIVRCPIFFRKDWIHTSYKGMKS